MSKKIYILILLLLFSLGLTVSCGSSGDDETEKLRKEIEEMKKEKTEQEIAELKEKVKDQEEKAEEDKKEDKKTTTATPKPKPKVAPPVGSTVARANTGNVVVRAEPDLKAKKVTGLGKGEKVYVMDESAHTDEWKGTQWSWKNIQKEDGTKGWVLGAFIDDF